MNKIYLLLVMLLISSNVFSDQLKVKWVSVSSTIDNGDVNNLLRCMFFESNGKQGVLLWKSSDHISVESDHEGMVFSISGKKIVFNDFCEVNFIQEDFTVKCVDSKNIKFSKNIRDYIKQKIDFEIPIIKFKPATT